MGLSHQATTNDRQDTTNDRQAITNIECPHRGSVSRKALY